jgi:hypothetical protein
MALWRSCANTEGFVPRAFGSCVGLVGWPCGHLNGDQRPTAFISGRALRSRACSRGRVRRTISAASPRWQSISCGDIVPQRRGVSGRSLRSLATSERSTIGFATVLIPNQLRTEGPRCASGSRDTAIISVVNSLAASRRTKVDCRPWRSSARCKFAQRLCCIRR